MDKVRHNTMDDWTAQHKKGSSVMRFANNKKEMTQTRNDPWSRIAQLSSQGYHNDCNYYLLLLLLLVVVVAVVVVFCAL